MSWIFLAIGILVGLFIGAVVVIIIAAVLLEKAIRW